MRTSCIKQRMVRYGGDFIIQKVNTSIDKFNPFVRLTGIIFDSSKGYYENFLY